MCSSFNPKLKQNQVSRLSLNPFALHSESECCVWISSLGHDDKKKSKKLVEYMATTHLRTDTPVSLSIVVVFVVKIKDITIKRSKRRIQLIAWRAADRRRGSGHSSFFSTVLDFFSLSLSRLLISISNYINYTIHSSRSRTIDKAV